MKLLNKYNSLIYFDISNLFLIKIFLLISLRKYLIKQLSDIPYFYWTLENLVISKGINTLKILKLLAELNNFYDYKILLEKFEIKKKIDYKKLLNIIEKNKRYINNYIQQFNLYLIIFMSIIYILPLILILWSIFYGINYFFTILIIVPIILFLFKKINDLKRYLKW
jgi:hypothetical protein